MSEQKLFVGDIVAIRPNERNLIPKWLMRFVGMRGYVTGVEGGFDFYKEEACISRLNDELFKTPDIVDSKEPYTKFHVLEKFQLVTIETLIPGYKYKVTYDDLRNEIPSETFYFVLRKHFYDIRIAYVAAPLFKKATSRLTSEYSINEDFLNKVGNKFIEDNAVVIPPFKERLLKSLIGLFIQPKKPEDSLKELLNKF